MKTDIGYLGGILKRNAVDLQQGEHNPSEESWHWTSEDFVCFLHRRGHNSCLRAREGICALITGHVVRRDQPLHTVQDIAEYLIQSWGRTHSLPLDELDGSFTVVLMDGTDLCTVVYRNLFGNSASYYSRTPEGIIFGSNLASLADTGFLSNELDESVLPGYFLNRHLLGRDTFFRNTYRLMVGEQLLSTPEEISLSQVSTFADFRDEPIHDESAPDQLDDHLHGILSEYQRARPGVANILSGGVDSSLTQAHWCALPENRIRECPSFSARLDHPRSVPDTEYALSASKILGTRHHFTVVKDTIEDLLLDTIGSLSEPPNDLQVVYCAPLARLMEEHQITTGICGEGADAAFGKLAALSVHNAQLLRKAIPWSPLRSLGSSLLRFVHKERWASYFDLANLLPNVNNWGHPLHTIARYTDWSSVEACFGRGEVQKSVDQRLGFLNQYQVKPDLMYQLHGLALVGSAINSSAHRSAMFESEGLDLVSPYLDSRTFRFLLNLSPSTLYPWRNPKGLLKHCLARLTSPRLAYRQKLGFGQPIFEWLSPSGSLSHLVEDMEDYSFVPQSLLRELKERPTWFLYSLLSLDLWKKQFLTRRLARPVREWGVRRVVGSVQRATESTLV